MATRMVWDRDAPETVSKIAQPGLRPAAEAIAETIPNFVPVVHGVMRASYHPSVAEEDDSFKVFPGSSFWHWMEYGTRYNPAYRPVQTAVNALGLRYEAH